MGEARLQRVAEEIKREIGKIVHGELRDPRIGFVTIARVQLTRDLRYAKIYFSLLGTKKQLRDTQIGLSRSAGFIRKLLSERIKLRYIPEVSFRLDETLEHSIHIAKILKKIKEEEEGNGPTKNNQ